MTTTTLSSKDPDKEKDTGSAVSLTPSKMNTETAQKGLVNNNGSINASPSVTTVEDSGEFQSYNRRWLMLALFVLYSSSNAFQWIQYAIINDVVVKFYNVGAEWVDWTSLIYMCVYIPLIFPATFLLQKKVSVVLTDLCHCHQICNMDALIAH
jgi:hypothetical protein